MIKKCQGLSLKLHTSIGVAVLLFPKGSAGWRRSCKNSPGAPKYTQRRPTHHSGITVERTRWAERPHDAHLPEEAGRPHRHTLSSVNFTRLVTGSIALTTEVSNGFPNNVPAWSNRERLAWQTTFSLEPLRSCVLRRPTGVLDGDGAA